MNNSDNIYLENYLKIVKENINKPYPGPETEGKKIKKFTILKSAGVLRYSNRTVAIPQIDTVK